MGPLREQPHSVLCGPERLSTRSRFRAQCGVPFAPPSPDATPRASHPAPRTPGIYSPPMTLAAGSRIGPYEIVAPIGAGGMGEVFRARDARLGRDVAIKILPTLFASDPDRLRRFESEARAAAALNHPNILVLHDVGTQDGVPYVVSELLDGQTLRTALERGPMPTRKAIEYGIQIASGLAAAHEKGIVHRDLKPENLFVTKDGRIKILDFGLAKLAEAVTTDASRATMAQTDPGMVVGTAGYMSPEQLRGEQVDARSDVFSLGAVLYEMFTGERAFKGKTAVDTMSAILKEDPADFPPGVHAASPAIERVVRRCLEKNVEERFQSARDVTFALEAMSSASGIKPAMAAAEARERRWLPIVAAIAALALVAAAAYLAGARFGSRTAAPPSVTQLTFRKGTVRGARFSPDGQTVYYAASWEGEPITLYSTRLGSPESSPVGVPASDMLGISSSGELALALNAHVSAPFLTLGTLARAPMSGGAPREILENVNSADFSPAGPDLAAIQTVPGRGSSLQFPIGTERVNAPYWLSDARVSPDGSEVAFIAHPQGGDEGDVRLAGRTGSPRSLSTGWISIQGLHWSPSGRELWFTGTRTGMLRALWAVTLDGHERLLYRAPLRLQLEDVAPDGRVLLSGMSVEGQVRFGAFGEKGDRSLSWFDWGTSATLSADGKLLAYTESGEGAGSVYGVFVRPTNGGPAVRLADGGASAISPDGRLVAVLDTSGTSIRIVPTGAGITRTIDITTIGASQGSAWFPDNQHLVIAATQPGHGPRSYTADITTGRLTPITPEGTAGRIVSPNGEWLLAGRGPVRGLVNLHTGAFVPMPGVTATDRAAGWSADSSAIFGFVPGERGVSIFRMNIPSGPRTPVATVEPGDPAGLLAVGNVIVAADGTHYAYNVFRQLSQLFVISGLK